MANDNILEMQDAILINKGLKIRETIVDELFKDNKIPASQEDRELLIRSIEGIDKTILAKTKIRVEKDNAKNADEVTKLMAGILSRVSVKKAQGPKTTPVLPADIKVTNPIPGETEIGVVNNTYEQFMKK